MTMPTCAARRQQPVRAAGSSPTEPPTDGVIWAGDQSWTYAPESP